MTSRWTISRAFCAVLFLAMLVASGGGCGSDEGAAPPSTLRDETGKVEEGGDDPSTLTYAPSFEPDYMNLVPRDEVEVVTQAERDTVVVMLGGVLAFSKSATPAVAAWAPGRVVVSAPGRGAGTNPFGFARRVTSVEIDGDRILVHTVSVGLEDLVSGDFQQRLDPSDPSFEDVDLSKVDLETVANDLYGNETELMTFPEALTSDAPAIDDPTNATGGHPSFLKKLKKLGKAVKAVAKKAAKAIVKVLPSSFSGSATIAPEINAGVDDFSLFDDLEITKTVTTSGGLPVELFVGGSARVSARAKYQPGIQVGAKVPNVLVKKGPVEMWLNVDSLAEISVGLHASMNAGVRSAGGVDGSALAERLETDVAFAEQVRNEARRRLLGDDDLSPAGGWRRPLWVSTPKTKVFNAGPVPIVITATAQLDLECGFEAKAGIDVDASLTERATFKFKTTYDSSSGVKATTPTIGARQTYKLAVLGGGEISASCGLIPRVNTYLYDTIGVWAGIRGSLVTRTSFGSTCHPPSSVPSGSVDLALSANVGVQIGGRLQAPGSSFAGTKGVKAGKDIGPLEPWSKSFPIVQKKWDLPTGLGWCSDAKSAAKASSSVGLEAGAACKRNSDCVRGLSCTAGTCGSHCGDGVQSGDETDLDCGGSCGPCPSGSECVADSDCESAACDAVPFEYDDENDGSKAVVQLRECAVDACFDGRRSGAETAIDCGGPSCRKCALGEAGTLASDCASGFSDGTYCVASACQDKTRNADESDVDCGGASSCARCGFGQTCLRDTDCASGHFCDYRLTPDGVEGGRCDRWKSPPQGPIVFVTSDGFDGDLGGLAGADAKCRAAAERVSLPGSFKAFLSDGTSNAATRLGRPAGAYRRTDGVVVATSADALFSGTLLAPIRVDERGIDIGTMPVWTGSNGMGLAIGGSCDGWASSLRGDADVRAGAATASGAEWAVNDLHGCDEFLSLYCVEQ